jgi:hypothetical protein
MVFYIPKSKQAVYLHGCQTFFWANGLLNLIIIFAFVLFTGWAGMDSVNRLDYSQNSVSPLLLAVMNHHETKSKKPFFILIFNLFW